MKQVKVDGQTLHVFAERNDEDGGIITNTLVPAGDGTYYNHRAWVGHGVEGTPAQKAAAQERALADFHTLSEAELAARAKHATAMGVSGKTHGKAAAKAK